MRRTQSCQAPEGDSGKALKNETEAYYTSALGIRSRDVVQISTGNSNGDYYMTIMLPPQAYAPHLTYNVKGSLELATKTSKVLSNSLKKLKL